MKSRAMIIGGVDSGKTTLTDALLDREHKPKKVKTQALIYDDWIVDTPGEYTENPMYYRNLIATAMEITHVLYLQDATRNKTIFAPRFSSGINKLPIGIITKADHEDANIEQAIDYLKMAMVQGPIVIVSAYTGQGLEEVKDLIKLSSIEAFRSYVEASESEHLLFHEG